MLSLRAIRICSRSSFSWKGTVPLTRVRFISSGGDAAFSVSNIPAPPPIPVAPVPVPSPVLDPSQLPLEPTFESLGLGGYSPVGLLQSGLEFLHVNCGIPWWGTIVIGTVCIRVLLSPIVILSQKNTAKMTNCMPRMTELQKGISDARLLGDPILGAHRSQELAAYLKANNVSPFKNALLPLVQLPFFLSFFIGLRRMANCPVESMTEGGLWWFTNLTMPDQFYILPVMTSLTMWATIELSVDGKLSGKNASLLKYVVKAIPIVMLPFTINFSSAILCYWFSTNTVSLIQVGILKIPAVRETLKIPAIVADKSPTDKKGFVENAKDAWKNMKMTRDVESRQRGDEIQFNRAGKGPLVKTYKFDPTKVISAKKSQ